MKAQISKKLNGNIEFITKCHNKTYIILRNYSFMVEMVFLRKYQVDRNSFSEEIKRKFGFANEYFEVLLSQNKGNSKGMDSLILKLTKRQNFKGEYLKLNEREKVYALDLIYTIAQLKPELIHKNFVTNVLNSEQAKGSKAIMSSLDLLDKYLEEREKNKNREKIPFFESQNKIFRKITSVGRRIIIPDSEYLRKNNWTKMA